MAFNAGLLRLSASVATIPVKMLLDSGASHNFRSLDFVVKLGVAVTTAPAVQAYLANGSTLTT